MTSEKVLINEKCKSKFNIPNNINLILTSNCINPIPIGEKERRLLPIQISDDFIGNKTFWYSFY